MQPVMRLIVEVRALTGAGSSRVDDGALRQAQADRPEAAAIGRNVGSVRARTAKHAAASEPDGTQLSGPRTCGLVPVEVELDRRRCRP